MMDCTRLPRVIASWLRWHLAAIDKTLGVHPVLSIRHAATQEAPRSVKIEV